MDIKIPQLPSSLNPRAGTTVDDLFLAEWNKEQEWSLAVGLQELPRDAKVLSDQARDGLLFLLKESNLLLTNERAKEANQVITEGLIYLLSTGFCIPLSQHQREKQSPQQAELFCALEGPQASQNPFPLVPQVVYGEKLVEDNLLPQLQGPSLKKFGSFGEQSDAHSHPFLPEGDPSPLYSGLSFPWVKEQSVEKGSCAYSPYGLSFEALKEETPDTLGRAIFLSTLPLEVSVPQEEYAIFKQKSETSKADLSPVSLNSDLEPPPQRLKTVDVSLQPVNGQEEKETEIAAPPLKSVETLSGVTTTDASADTPVLGPQDQVAKPFIKQELLGKREPQLVLVKTIEITLPTPDKPGTLKLELSPAHLGRVDISVTISEDGRINAVIQTEKSEAFHLLAKDQTGLQKVITEAFGKELENFNLFMGMEQGTSQGQNRKEAFDFYQLELQEISGPPLSQNTASDILLSLRAMGTEPQEDLNHLDTWV